MYKKSYAGKSYAGTKKAFTFRNLEVYQKTMECSVIVAKDFRPVLSRLKYPFMEEMTACSMEIPLLIGESHSVRYADFPEGVALMEKAMANCNKMIIYLEQVKGIYGEKIKPDLLESVINRYVNIRVKMFRLERAWKKYHEANPDKKKELRPIY